MAADLRVVSGSGQGSGQFESRHWSDRIVQHDSRMIQDFLKLERCLAVTRPSGNKPDHARRLDRVLRRRKRR